MSETANFEKLSPLLILDELSAQYGLECQPLLTPFNSYVNRVFGVKDSDSRSWIVKFYRPGRWSEQTLHEEHLFLMEAGEADLPVVQPLVNREGNTLSRSGEFFWAVFEQKGGRTFEGESLEDLRRLGNLVGRLHTAAARRGCPHRLVLTPQGCGDTFADELWDAGVVHPDFRTEFFDVIDTALNRMEPLFTDKTLLHRLHGDLHRGNVLERGEEGLLLMDFDDMLLGPPVQDLWMFLPDRVENCPEQVTALEEGYAVWRPFDRSWWKLVEPLRFLRNLYFLTWCSRQRSDKGFYTQFPDWGSRAFWIKELEDLKEQFKHL
ncbi:MAG: serine/threonine protein kinase [Spirochaetales bacterium]|nr:serine/threonine protein kinase [Spirochaetales bacterium]